MAFVPEMEETGEEVDDPTPELLSNDESDEPDTQAPSTVIHALSLACVAGTGGCRFACVRRVSAWKTKVL